MQTMSSQELLQGKFLPSMLLAAALAPVTLSAQQVPAGDAARGQAFFQISCAVCHSPVLGPDNLVLMKQGPSLVGVVGRPAGSLPQFNYTKALQVSGLTWNPATLYHFLENPMEVVPGTTMPIPVADPRNRADVVAYLATLKIPQGVTLEYEALPETAEGVARVVLVSETGDRPWFWRRQTAPSRPFCQVVSKVRTDP